MKSTSQARAPWWMYLFAASFLAYFSVGTYNDLRGPEPPGMHGSYHGGAMVLAEVESGSAAERAGLLAGDHIISLDAQPIGSAFDWLAILANLEINVPHKLEVARGHRRLQLTLALWQQKPFTRWQTDDQVSFLSERGAQLLMLLLSLVIAFNRPYDIVARIGALVLAYFSGVSSFTGLAALWRHLPPPIGALMWIANLSTLPAAPALLFTFCAVFPQRLFQKRWIWIAAWLPMVFCLPGYLALLYHLVYRPERLTGVLPFWLLTVMILVRLGYYLAGFAALIVNYRRLKDVNQRRRVRVLVAGFVAGLLPYFVEAVLSTYFPILQQRPVGKSLLNGFGYLAVATFPIFPLSFAYAILRHQLFDIRLIIRQGLQYAAARGVLLYLVPASMAALVLDLLRHSDQTLGAVLSQRGWPYGVVIGLAFLAHFKRHNWMDALDRRFFRERYNSQQILRETVEEVRISGALEAAAPKVVARIQAALHLEFASLMVHKLGTSVYRTIAAAPDNAAPMALDAESKLMAVFCALGKPLAVSLSESSWLKQKLPTSEIEFLRDAKIDLLIPIVLGTEQREALLALGQKKSEEPYSSEDQELLTAIASALALLVERGPTKTARTGGMEECPQCGRCYESGTGTCTEDTTRLRPLPVPRLLAGRYQLERRLGRGGMGTVYSALDRSLGRKVAVKLIREDLVTSTEMASRFEREAKTAASLLHPNMAAIFDYGVDASGRAFLVMEFLEGRSLREKLQVEKRIQPGQALFVFEGVCAALGVAHGRNLVHRDLKPENIFLVRNGDREAAKLLDFGLAKSLPVDVRTMHYGEQQPELEETADAATAPGLLVGTPRYMSPEQIRGEAVSPTWDIWALSVVTYEVLTGKYPFTRKTMAECHEAILLCQYTPLKTLLPDAPTSWEDFFSYVLHRDASQRPPSVAAWHKTLERVLIGEAAQ